MPSQLATRKLLELRRRQLPQRHIDAATLIGTQRAIRRSVGVAMRRAELAHIAGQMSERAWTREPRDEQAAT